MAALMRQKKYLKKKAEELPLIIVNESRPGKSRALNKALSQANGDLLVFTDDDVVVDPEWLKQLYKVSKRIPACQCFWWSNCC